MGCLCPVAIHVNEAAARLAQQQSNVVAVTKEFRQVVFRQSEPLPAFADGIAWVFGSLRRWHRRPAASQILQGTIKSGAAHYTCCPFRLFLPLGMFFGLALNPIPQSVHRIRTARPMRIDGSSPEAIIA